MKELRKLMSTEDYIRVLETTVEADTRTIRYAVSLLQMIQEFDTDAGLPKELKGRLLYFLYKARRVDPLDLPLDGWRDFIPERDTRVFPEPVNMQSAILKHNKRPVGTGKREKASRPRLLRNLARLTGMKSTIIYKMDKEDLEAALLETYPDLNEWDDARITSEIERLNNGKTET